VTGKRPRDGVTPDARPRPARPRTASARRLRPGLPYINETTAAVPGQTRIASAAAGNFA